MQKALDQKKKDGEIAAAKAAKAPADAKKSRLKATLKNYRQSPRKVRLVADLVKGKSLAEALTLLKFNIRRSADPVAKLLASAAANAQKQGENPNELVVKNITVNEAPTMCRIMPRARGSAYRIRKRSSHVTVTLDKKK